MSDAIRTSALRPRRRSLFTLAGLMSGAAALSACTGGTGSGGGAGSGGEGPVVIATCYPVAFLAGRLGGDALNVVNLATPGADAHGLELSVRQVAQLQEAALVVQIPGYQAAIDDAIASQGTESVLDVSSVIELLPAGEGEEHEDHAEDSHEQEANAEEDSHEGHDHGPTDPHFWHDPLRMADLSDALAERLGEVLPEQASAFTEHATALRGELEELDTELAGMFDPVAGERPFVTSHAAYTYLASRYDLHQIGISGVDPEVEPSPQRLLELEHVIEDEGVTTIFFETTASPKVAQTLADNVGVQAEELDNLETQLSEDADYPQVMRDNASKLVASWS